jgi:hypothetical protein
MPQGKPVLPVTHQSPSEMLLFRNIRSAARLLASMCGAPGGYCHLRCAKQGFGFSLSSPIPEHPPTPNLATTNYRQLS